MTDGPDWSRVEHGAVLVATLRNQVQPSDQNAQHEAATCGAAFGYITQSVIEAHGGLSVESQAGTVVAVFDAPHHAARAALEMQAMVRKLRERHSGPSLEIGIGLVKDSFRRHLVKEFGYASESELLARRLARAVPSGTVLATWTFAEAVGQQVDVTFALGGVLLSASSTLESVVQVVPAPATVS